jgi:NAD(P)-dependent dehydrogenase (short-subunit alcohol dehydrogenase family)
VPSHVTIGIRLGLTAETRKEETMKAQRIEGAVALVTGAGRGIGRALTEALLTRGVKKVYATARNPEALRALRDERLVSLRLDVTNMDQIRAAVEAASDVELVFNNAGVALATGIADSTVVDQARREMEVNYFGPLQLLQRLAPTLARNGGRASSWRRRAPRSSAFTRAR